MALKQAATPEFKAYQEQVVRNCKAFAEALTARGYSIVSGGTDNHLLLVDLRPLGVDGSRVERVLELAHIAANKNTVPGDVSALVPGGIRMGTPALTTRGFIEKDFVAVAEFFHRAVGIALGVKAKLPAGAKLKEFKEALPDAAALPELAALEKDVEAYAKLFPTIGFDVAGMRYKH